MKESDKLSNPIITPTTKASEGHDMDISKEAIISTGIIAEAELNKIYNYALALFARGSEIAGQHGLILVDTKYEFGYHQGEITLMDEIHTPDSSRYYVAEGYEEKQKSGEHQKQLSKEFVREWLMAHGFQGLEDQLMPEMPDAFVWEISKRYIELFEKVTGKEFHQESNIEIKERIKKNLEMYLSN